MEIDLAFVVDCTGSMSSWISKVKDIIGELVSKLEEEGRKARFALVAYRDWCDTKRLETLQFTDDLDKFRGFVSALSATGGGDFPEDVLGGLWQATFRLRWRMGTVVKMMYHICDAPPHGERYVGSRSGDDYPDGHERDPTPAELFGGMKEINLIYVIGQLNTSTNTFVSRFTTEGAENGVTVKTLPCEDVKELLDSVLVAVSYAVRLCETTTEGETAAPIALSRPVNIYKSRVAIDFGTDGTGFAYSLPGGGIGFYEGWASGGRDANLKCKTCILLDRTTKECKSFGDRALSMYTNSRDSPDLFFERFKMALYERAIDGKTDYESEGTDIALTLKAAKRVAQDGTVMEAVEVESMKVIIAALKFVKERVVERLSETEGVAVAVNDIQWYLTVPAIWSGRAKDKMMSAARAAGMITERKHDQIQIVFEPDCGSIAARDDCKMSEGDRYMLMDLGGGTADIACHEAGPALAVNQIRNPTGGAWGSTYVDGEFTKLLDEVFGKAVNAKFQEQQPHKWLEVMQAFRMAKHSFQKTGVTDAHNVILPLAYLEFLDGECGDYESMAEDFEIAGEGGLLELDDETLVMSRKVWVQLFDAVLNPMIEHCVRLLEAPFWKEDGNPGCKHIVMVGGFSDSPYVQQRVKQAFETERHVPVFASPKPGVAVLRGAIMLARSPTLMASFAMPKAYGISVRREAVEHDRVDRRIKDKSGEDVVDNAFYVFVHKNEKVRAGDNEVRLHTFVPEDPRKIVVQLFSSELDEAPLYTDVPGVKEEGEPMEFSLGDDWGLKPIRIGFYFNSTVLKMMVGLPHLTPEECMRQVTYADS